VSGLPDLIRIGLVGCGRIAERGYAPAFRRASGVRLAAVADPMEERCARVAPGLPSFPDAETLVEAERVDAIVLATPARFHLPDARAAAKLGIPVLVEKPPAQTLAEARKLAELEPGPHMAFNRRYEPGVALLRPLAAHTPGLRLELELRTRPSSWRAYVADDDVLHNLGPHPVDLARWLSGAEIARVRATIDGDRISLDVELVNGARASISLHGDRPYRERVVAQAQGRRLGSYRAGGPWAAVRSVASRNEHPLASSLAAQLEAFAAAVRGASPVDLADADDGVAVMATLDAAGRSAGSGGDWQQVSAV
jgi:myo-inositol 2-dehydrogenase / D-chiro-inositol 1-dehydrogenase